MRTIEEIKDEIRDTEQELIRLKNEFSDLEFLGTSKFAYEDIQEKILQLQNEINKDILYIKNVYNQLLTIKARAELLVRKNNDQEAIKISQKVYEAFLLLIEFNKTLDEKIAKRNVLIEERNQLIQKSETTLPAQISKVQEELWSLKKELRNTERQESVSEQAINRIIEQIRQFDRIDEEIQENERKIADIEAAEGSCCKCGAKRILKENSQQKKYFWGCPKYKEEGKHTTESYSGDKSMIKELFEKKKQDEQFKKQLPKPVITEVEKEAFQNASLKFDEYPNILETDYNNYLFQSLAVPTDISIKDYTDELLKYSRFRIFTKLPQVHDIDDRTRTVYSLALRMLNRGVVLSTNQKTEAKIKHYFEDRNASAFLSILNEYICYEHPQIQHDSNREVSFAEDYFPKTLGNAWATYVYPQMDLTLLLPKEHKKEFKDKRVDFFVCYDNKKIVIELDGEEHKSSSRKEEDARRNNVLEKNGYKVLRFENCDVDRRALQILLELDKYIKPSLTGMLVPCSEKYLVACKVTHQITIAIVKMLEEGHISSRCNLNLEISDNDLFSSEEKRLILFIAVEEARELLEHFAELYGVELDLDFFDENSEKYWIKIGDGDNNRNSIVIRDIVLPINYLCSIHPFALVMPEKDAVTEEVLEYFLQYAYGYAQFRPGQFVAIRRTLRKEESIVLLPTGSGKSVIYQLSSMLLPGITVVISPLKALIEDQVNNLADKGVNNVASIFSADKKSKDEMIKKARAIMNNHSAMMLYIAPERMQMPDFRKEVNALLKANNFCLIAIDEAHCVSEWGHDFRAAYLQIGRACRRMFRKEEFVPPIIALTGTASDNVLRDVKRDLEISNTDAIITPPTFDRPELHYSIIPCDSKQKYDHIKDLLKSEIPQRFGCSFDKFSELNGSKTNSGIIFTILAARKKKNDYDAWTLFNRLNKEKTGLQSGTYFAKAPQRDVEDETWNCVIKSYAHEFKENQRQLLVATKAFGMGIDKPNIRYVIHNSLPNSIEQYYQEVGRAGRDRAHSECIMLFSNSNDAGNETLLNPNLDWDNFKKEYDKVSNNDRDDISPLMYFHENNFQGPEVEKDMLFTVMSFLRKLSEDFKRFSEDRVISISETKVYKEYLEKTDEEKYKNLEKAERSVPDGDKNNIAKAIIRLVTLGIIKDYEYDYSKSEYKLIFGNINRNSVLEKYLIFVDGCSRGRSDKEKMELEQVQGDDRHFICAVINKYVDLVYGTIEKGRRRALHSMYRLAKNAVEIEDPDKQDEYIRVEIQNYLVKDDTVDLVKSSDRYAGIDEIFNAYPLYPNDVIVDSIEQENAKKTSGYAARVLATDPYHPGLLYLHSITSIKSRIYNDIDIVNDIVAAYENSEKYNIPSNKATEFLVKTMNLTFNSSCELFELLWNKIDGKYISDIVKKTMELSENDISKYFKDYLLLHIAAQSLRKMIGDK